MSLDRLDLVEWLDLAQREAGEWRRKYHALRQDLDRWHEFHKRAQEPPANENKARSDFRDLFAPDEEIRNAEDPLAAILERNPPDEPAGLF